ncbi:Calpain-like cysteine protease C2 [Phytophthora megakarya]|uniref:Calpain-like cysteine protease C2 n=1 Tax=Phytophthora megakarya TaxID=4795 RepID=A0A225X1K4_9STRA|nr:Calpain-like cysteine protease C2 [Phytophthora megakarya]
MPPKKLPSKLTPQGSGVNPPSTARNYREPVTTPNLPPNEAISPLWTPNSAPTEVFPEWTDPAALPVEHWGTVEEPFDDTLANANLLVPYEVIESKGTITWKRPCQFLPVIVDAPVHATPPPMSDPKTTAKKGAPVAKKGEPEPKKLPPPKHAHRRWSDEQTEALQAWTREEERIEREQQYRERVYMGFEDAIAYIVNERPRDLLADVDFDADDLVDDGEDEDDVHTTDMDVSNATSPWGVMPPSRIEIAPNAIYKPEVPHGEVVHADMASYFRIVEQLYSTGDDNTSVSVASPGPFLWQAIYPQDSTGQPVYNPGGKYSVKLFVFGRWRRVDVDDKLPLDRDGNVVYLSSSMKSEIWPCLLVKALYKVANWLHPNLSKANEDVQTRTNIMFQTLVQIVLALTSWKVSRWEPKVNSILSENGFHQLLRVSTMGLFFFLVVYANHIVQYVPSSEEPEEVELSVESESGEAVIKIPDEPEITKLPEPRVIICFTGVSKVADMIFGEVVLVKPDHNLDNMCKSSELMATHLGGDPTGSVILIEELQKKKSSRSSLPAIVTLNSMFSGNICVSPADNGTMVYRVYPQSTLRYGYSLQVESDHLISFQDAPTYWRSLADFHVIESEGAYPVMLPETWNILFKHSFTLVSPTKEDGDNRPISPELRIDLHLSEELLASFTHISIVNDVTGDVKKVGTLCTNVTLPAGSNSAPIAYTLIVDCVTGDFHVREGKWKLTLASEWDFTKSTTHQMKMTRFEGMYEPNKPLLCFRDVIMAPKSSVWTSFQLQLLKDGIVVNELATKLEVFDLATDQNPLLGDTDLLRVPSDIKWRLNCWSSEEVKLLEDNTKELQFEAIRASWAEKSADRNTNGAVSRFLYLGKMDEAEARMKQDNMTDEQIAKVRNRFEWIRAIKAKVSARTEQGVSESYLEEVSTREEKLLTEEELSENKRLLLERIGAVEADKDQRRVGRALGKGERANALKNMIRSVVDKRAVFLKKQQELKRELAAVQTQSA